MSNLVVTEAWTESKQDLVLKRIIDIMLSGLALVILSPLLLVTAAAIKLDSSGPVIFRQRRRGFNGREFAIYKFRTMTVLEDGPNVRQAQRHDERVTWLGRLLRSSSIDELPQLINVLTGEMCLVGPRPKRRLPRRRILQSNRELCVPASRQAGHHGVGAGQQIPWADC